MKMGCQNQAREDRAGLLQLVLLYLLLQESERFDLHSEIWAFPLCKTHLLKNCPVKERALDAPGSKVEKYSQDSFTYLLFK